MREVDTNIITRDRETASALSESLRTFLSGDQKLRDYLVMHQKIREEERVAAAAIRVMFLSSFTISQIKELVEVESFIKGCSANVYIGPVGQYEQMTLNTKSELYMTKPSLIVVALRLEELMPGYFDCWYKIHSSEREKCASDILSRIEAGITAIREQMVESKILIFNFAYPSYQADGVLDAQSDVGLTAWVDELNMRLRKVVSNCTDAFIFDFKCALYQFGVKRAIDEKMWFIAQQPYGYDFLVSLAQNIAHYIWVLFSVKRKCLAIDLDNTLWGGIIAEDGLHGIQLGHNYPGNIYRDIQARIKALSASGVILAINSKNNEQDAKEAFTKHPDMLLRWDDFSAHRVNWKDKAENMRTLAEELNIGLDSFVFVDDSPAEVNWVASAVPDVTSILLPNDPLGRLKAFRELDLFDSPTRTDFDFRRSEIYRSQTLRKEFKAKALSLEQFLFGLEMKAEIAPVTKFAVKRVTQLIQKTNQFNLTSRRYSESEIDAMERSGKAHIFYLRLVDRFGDNGITGAVIAKEQDQTTWILDTFLLSCRIIGRTAEVALLSYLQEYGKRRGIKKLVGEYIPTAKNGIVKNFYSSQGFVKEGDSWALNSNVREIGCPEWIKIN